MIDLNKTRSLKTLEKIKQDLVDFTTVDRAEMIACYDSKGWGEEDYEADLEQVKELLERVERRINSLSHYLNKQKVKGEKSDTQSPDEKVSQDASQSS